MRKLVHILMTGTALFTLTGCAPDMPEDSATSEVGVKKPVYTDAEEALYLERYNAPVAGRGLGLNAYDPLADVAGAAPPTPLPKTSAPTITPEALTKARDYAAERNSTALFIWRNGQMVLEEYFGETTEATPINSRALAKPLGVIAIGRAIKEGHIKTLDQPVSDFITEWKGTEKEPILIRHILDMRSGLLPQGLAKGPEDVLRRAYLHPRHDKIIIHDYPLTHEPGSRYEYSNANSELVAVVIERATNQPYEAWVSGEILKPLGATGGHIWMNREGGTPHAGCCILLPARTFLRFAILYLNDGVWGEQKLLPEGFMTQVRTATPQNPHSGMGVYLAGPYIEKRGALNPELPFGQTLHADPYLANDLYLFDGNGHQVAYIIPSTNTIIMRLGTRPPEGLVWDNSVLPNTLIKGMDFTQSKAPTPQVK